MQSLPFPAKTPAKTKNTARALTTFATVAVLSLAPASPFVRVVRAQTTYTYKGSTGTTSAPSNGNFNNANSFDNSLPFDGTTYGANDATFVFGGTTNYTTINNLTGALALNVLKFTNTGNVTVARGTNSGAKNQLVFNQTSGNLAPTIVLNNTGTLLVDQDMVFNAATTISGNGSATFAGALSGSGNFTYAGGSAATLTLSGISSLTGIVSFNGGMTLISAAAGSANAASFSTSAFASIGTASGSTGTVTVSGVNGTNASTFNIGGSLFIGNEGTGTLNVTNGALAQSGGNTIIGTTSIGDLSNSTGTVTVSGVSGANVSTLNVGGSLYVGNFGMGTLTVMDGAMAQSGSDTVIGQGGGTVGTTSGGGTVTVSGTNTTGGATLVSTLSAGRDLYVGSFGTGAGTLNVMGGALAKSTGNTLIGNASGSTGTATISGVSSTGVASTLNVGSILAVGLSGTGTLNVTGGALASSVSDTVIGYQSGGVGTVKVSGVSGAKVSTFNVGDQLQVGSSGTGTLNVTGGALATSGGSTFIGAFSGSTGTATISGVSGAKVSTLNVGDTLYVGSSGTGTLNVMDGASASATNFTSIGDQVGGVGTVNISGTSIGGSGGTASTLTAGDELDIGYFGTGTLNVTNGGKVIAPATFLSDQSGSSSSLIINGGSFTTDTIQIGADNNGVGTVTAFKLTNPTQANGGGYALTIGGSNGSSTISPVISDALAGDGGAGTVGGAGGIRKTGTGTLTLGGANTFSGATQIDSGSVILNNQNALQNSTAIINVNNGLNLNGLTNATLGGLSGNNSGSLALGSTNLSVGNNGTSTTYAGTLSGMGSLTKIGSGSLTLSGANTFTGNTTINAGSVILGNSLALQNSTAIINVANGLNLNGFPAVTLGGLAGNNSGSLAVGNLTTLSVGNNNANTTYAGTLSGGGSLTKIGSGNLTLTGTNTLSGRTRIQGGSVIVGSQNALQNTTATIQVDNGLNLNNLSSVTLGGLAGTGDLARGTTALSVGGNNADTTYGGVMSGAGTLIKTGSGTLTLTGASTSSGGATISAGAIAATGTGLGTGRITVGSGGTLNVGEVPNATRTAQSVSTLTITSLTLAPNGSASQPQLTFNLGANNQSDQLFLTGGGNSVFLLSSSGTFYIGFASATGTNLTSEVFTLMTFTNQTNALSLPDISLFKATPTGNVASLSTPANPFQYVTSGGQTFLTFTINSANTPEPSSLALLAWTIVPVGVGVARRRFHSGSRRRCKPH